MAFGFCAAFVSSAGQSFFIGLFGPAMQAALGMGSARWGAVYGLATLVSGVAMFWLGAIVDRLHPTRAISLALGLLAMGAGLMAGVQGVFLLFLALLCLRLGGQGLASHLAIVVAARHALKRGRSVSVATFGYITSEAALPLIVTAALAVFDWRWLWGGVVFLLVAVAWPGLYRLALPLPGVRGGHVPRDAPVIASVATPSGGLRRRDLLRSPRFLAAVSVLVLPPFAVTAVFVQQGTLGAMRNWQPAWVALAFVCFAVAQAGTTWLAGRWVDRRGARGLLRLYLWPMAAGAALLMLPPTLAPQPVLWGLFVGLGATGGAQSVLSGALWAELFGLEHLGMVRGVYAAIMVVASAAGPWVLGGAFDLGLPLGVVAGALVAYVLVVPQLAWHWLAMAGDPLAKT